MFISHQTDRTPSYWSTRLLGAASAIALAAAIGVVTPQPASALICDSSNPNEPAGATDGGQTDNTACGQNSEALGVGFKSTAYGWDADALAVDSTAIGANSQVDADSPQGTAVGRNARVGNAAAGAGGDEGAVGAQGGVALGRNAFAQDDFAVSVGESSSAEGNRSVAVGKAAHATGAFSMALGNSATASGSNSTAVGAASTAGFANSTAIGTGAQTTTNNEMVFGRSSESYTTPGITSATSRSRQSGPLQMVTSDANGHLATDGGAIFSELDQLQRTDKQLRRDIDTVESGVAVALSAVGPDLTGMERFGLSLNWGGFEGASAIGGGGTAVIHRGERSRFAVTGGIGVGFDGDDPVGGRAGGQLTW